MAQIDPSIAMSIRPAQIESPLVHAARAAELQGAQQSQFMNMLKMKEYGDESRTKNAMMKWLSDKPDLDDDKNINTLATQFGAQGLALAKQIDERRKARSEAAYRTEQTEDLKSQRAKRGYELGESQTKNAINTISGLANRQQALAMLYESEANGTIPREAAESIRSMIPYDDEEFPAFKQSLIERLMTADQRVQYGERQAALREKQAGQAYADYVYEAVERGEKPISRTEFLERQQQPAPVAAPVADAMAPTADAAAPAAAPEPAGIFAPRPAPAAATTTATATTTAPETSMPDMSAKAAAYIRSGNPALIKLGEEIQKKFLKDVEANRPTYSEINLQNEVAVVKRDPATGKTTIVERFPIGISPADKQRLINDSIRIKQDNRRIQLDAQRVSLETKRVAIAEQNAARDADPAFQQRMAAARATGETIAKDAVKAQQALPSVIARGEESIRLIDDLIGKRDKDGNLLKGQAPHPGFETAVGATWLPGSRFVPGTSAADFQARYEQLKGASFLEAFETLKGGGQITEKEGEKATAAINRMALAQSEAEFIAAAREVQNILTTGIKNAKTRAKVAPAGQSPVRSQANVILGIP